jgi:hypothetical protein
MKKFLSMGLLTVCALAVADQEAHAWVNGKFSVGLNWQVQSANNSFLWGVFKNGQVPGPEAFGQPGPGHGHFGPGGGYMPPAAQQPFPYFGAMPGYNQPAPAGYPQVAPKTAPTSAPTNAAVGYYYNPYQTASYQPYQNYYPYGSVYYYPQQAPYYWYQSR